MPDPNRRSLPIRFLIASGRILWTSVETRLIGLILGGAIVFAGGATIWNRIEDADARQRQADVAAAEDKVYNAAVDVWEHDTELYNACLARVESQAVTRDDLRSILFAITDLSDVFPGEALADTYRENRKALINDRYEPIDIAARQETDCVKPGLEPTPPEES